MKKVYKYHLGDDGIPRPCHDSSGKCPYGHDFHFSTRDEARLHFEFLQSDNLLNAVSKPFFDEETELKTLGPRKLAELFNGYVLSMDMDESQANSALFLGSFLHQKQRRGARLQEKETAYIEHPLRNAIRVMKWGCKDETVIIGCMLHDTIEDTSGFFVEKIGGDNTDPIRNRNILTAYIEKSFGSEVKRVVVKVTNPHMTSQEMSKISRSDRDILYVQHVETGVKDDPQAFVVKLSDYFDNAGSLPHQDFPGNERATAKRARKYLLAMPVFKKYIHHLDKILPPEGKKRVIDQLSQIEKNLERIVDKYKDL